MHTRELDAYVDAALAGAPDSRRSRAARRYRRAGEAIMLALRTAQGVGLRAFKERYGIDCSQHYEPVVDGIARGPAGAERRLRAADEPRTVSRQRRMRSILRRSEYAKVNRSHVVLRGVFGLVFGITGFLIGPRGLRQRLFAALRKRMGAGRACSCSRRSSARSSASSLAPLAQGALRRANSSASKARSSGSRRRKSPAAPSDSSSAWSSLS